MGVPAESALRELGDRALGFHALSLDGQGRPIPILNSDEGFRLLLTEPTPADMENASSPSCGRFQRGCVTDAGLVVANPALAGSELESEFSRFAYHGTVIWSWQQALLAAGIERQLRRGDLPEDTRAQLLPGAPTIVGGHRRLAGAAYLGALVLVVRCRPVPHRALRPAGRRCG